MGKVGRVVDLDPHRVTARRLVEAVNVAQLLHRDGAERAGTPAVEPYGAVRVTVDAHVERGGRRGRWYDPFEPKTTSEVQHVLRGESEQQDNRPAPGRAKAGTRPRRDRSSHLQNHARPPSRSTDQTYSSAAFRWRGERLLPGWWVGLVAGQRTRRPAR
jgi:hypothetical protein